MKYGEWKKAFVGGGSKKRLEKVEMIRRKVAPDGHEIIDKPTYNKLTRDFIKRGGIIIRGEDAERHLQIIGAAASYIVGENIAFIRDDASISEVLEEMYHAFQDRKKMYGEKIDSRVLILREIDAKKYLISVTKKFKIPIKEQEATKAMQMYYEAELEKLTDGSVL